MKALRNWTGTIHASRDGIAPVCGKLQTHASWLSPSDEPITCERCLAMVGPVEVEPLPAQDEDPRERRARERAARQAARRA